MKKTFRTGLVVTKRGKACLFGLRDEKYPFQISLPLLLREEQKRPTGLFGVKPGFFTTVKMTIEVEERGK